MKVTVPNDSLQATPDFAFEFFLARAPGVPELRCWVATSGTP